MLIQERPTENGTALQTNIQDRFGQGDIRVNRPLEENSQGSEPDHGP